MQETQNDANDVTPTSTAGDNYWGYMTLELLLRRIAAMRPIKAPGGPTREFKAMVKAFHDAGIKVYIDVVYNHTGEGGAWNSNDKTIYNLYLVPRPGQPNLLRLTSDLQFSWDNTGVGGNYNTYNPMAQNLIVNSLRILARHAGSGRVPFRPGSGAGQHMPARLLQLRQDGSEQRDSTASCANLSPRPAAGGDGRGSDCRTVGDRRQLLPGRQLPRRLVGMERHLPRQFAPGTEQAGSRLSSRASWPRASRARPICIGDNGRAPWNSVNFMVAHDGFTLKDLYSCNGKNNNQAWPFGPSDGGDHNNNSWDQGGDAADQRRAARNGLAFLMLIRRNADDDGRR